LDLAALLAGAIHVLCQAFTTSMPTLEITTRLVCGCVSNFASSAWPVDEFRAEVTATFCCASLTKQLFVFCSVCAYVRVPAASFTCSRTCPAAPVDPARP